MKIWNNLILDLLFTSNFVAFLENLNFTSSFIF